MTIAPDWYRWDGNDLILHLQIQPRSSKDSFGEIHNNRLKLRLTAAPVDGKANQRLLAFLAKQFGIPKAAVSITAGESSRLKTVVLQNPSKTPKTLDLPRETAKNC
jgi:uncharacterized protein (TIGR00251 family)